MKNLKVNLGLMFSLCAIQFSYAQTVANKSVMGSIKEFTQKFTVSAKSSEEALLKVPISHVNKVYELKINFDASSKDIFEVVGQLNDFSSKEERSGLFSYSGNLYRIEGMIIFDDNKEAYKITTNEEGKVVFEEAKASDFKCNAPMPDAEFKSIARYQDEPNGDPKNRAIPILNSNLGAVGCIYLDFDGENVQAGGGFANGAAWTAAPINWSTAQMEDIWDLVSEDYRPFNINVTTDLAVYKATDPCRRIRCLHTTTKPAGSGGGGTAFYNAFNSCKEHTPALSFLTTTKTGAEVSSHEVGHTVNLKHDGGSSGASGDYWQGHCKYSVIMGSGYGKPVVHFSKGEYSGSNNKEDDLAIITNTKNNVGYRTDDHGNTTAAATSMINTTGTVDPKKNNGIIEKNTDKDYFMISTSGGVIDLKFNSGIPGTFADSPNLDIQARLLDNTGAELVKSDPTGLHAAINKTVPAGTYYVEIDGVGSLDASTTGYTDYCSLGYYEISGTYPQLANSIDQSMQESSYVVVYPVPNTGEFNVDLSFVQPKDVEITVLNVIGEVIHQEKMSQISNFSKPLSISENAKGLYLVQVTTIDGMFTRKVLVK